MTDNQFDNFLKNKLSDHVSAVPDGLWEKIAQANRDKRRGLWWWSTPGLITLSLAIALLAGGFSYYNTGSNGGSSSRASATLTPDEIKPISNPLHEAQAKAVDAHVSHSSNTPVEMLVADKYRLSEKNIADGKISKVKTIAKAESGITNRSLYKQSLIPGSAVSRTPAAAGRSIFKNDLAASTHIVEEQEFLTAQPLSFLATQQKKSPATLYTEKLSGNSFRGIDDCPSAFGARKNTWYAEVFASPDYANKTTSGAHTNPTYFARKDSSESYAGAFTAGIRLSKGIGEHLMVKTGLQYSQIFEKFSYKSENERKLTTVITIRTIIRNPGDTAIVRDTSVVEQIGYRIKKSYNKFKSVDIPLIIAYEWGNDKLKANINAGVIFNIYSWQKGEMLDTTFTPVSFDKANGQYFKQNIGIGLYAGLGLLKPLNEKTFLLFEPYLRYNMSNMTRTKSLFTQKFDIAGLNIGLRYKIK